MEGEICGAGVVSTSHALLQHVALSGGSKKSSRGARSSARGRASLLGDDPATKRRRCLRGHGLRVPIVDGLRAVRSYVMTGKLEKGSTIFFFFDNQ